MHSVYVKTLGCKVNTYDSHALETEFKAKGYQVVENPELADITVLNTCSVTENANKEARYLLRKFRRSNPNALVVATGCYVQTDSASLIGMEDIDLIFPNQAKERIVAISDEQHRLKKAGQPISIPKFPEDLKPVKNNRQEHFKSVLQMTAADPSQTRAFLKIQDGCNGFCSYCLIPYARGASRSVAADQVLTEVRRLIDTGIKEVVFAGIHLGDYGHDLGSQALSFTELIKTLFSWDDMIRVRISSLEPQELPEKLLKALSQRPELFCDHFHLPLQSGHDRILKMMRRTYGTQQYQETIALAKSYFPRANFGADVIPGFPGETAEEAQATIDFIKSVGLNYLHVFPYSKRPNTSAAKMPHHLPPAIIRNRAKELRDLSQQLKHDYCSSFINQEKVVVLWENDRDHLGRQVGRSNNYLEVVAPSSAAVEVNSLSKVKIKGFVEKGRMLGIPDSCS